MLPGATAWPAMAPPFSLESERVVSGKVVAEGVKLDIAPNGRFTFSSSRLGFSAAIEQLDDIRISGAIEQLDFNPAGFQLESRLDFAGLQGRWVLHVHEDSVESLIEFNNQPLEKLASLPAVPQALNWVQGGSARAGVRLVHSGAEDWKAEYNIGLDGLSFDSPEGRFAGEGLGISVAGDLRASPGGISAESRVELNTGQMLLENLYLDLTESPLELSLKPSWDSGRNRLTGRFHLIDPGTVELKAFFELPDLGDLSASNVHVNHLRLDFPNAYRHYLEPFAATWTLDGLEVTGAVEWNGAWLEGALYSGDLVVSDLSVVDVTQNRFALTGLNALLQPGKTEAVSRLNWRGLLLGRINLGPGQSTLDSEPGRFALQAPLELNVLGGKLRLNALSYTLPYAREQGRDHAYLSASLQDLEMKPLTRALGWPEFGGSISGDLPGASLNDGVLSLQGGIWLDVFGGTVQVSELQIERPFGVLPSLSASMEMQGLDLEQLTETFSFGRIGGSVDGYVRGLRVLDWEPVAFDAWLGTPQGIGKAGNISRQAVNHLATIGGGGAAAALTNPLLRVFNQFSYRRVGLGCRLENHVCEVSGVDEEDGGVLLLQGAGIPKITIRAYNRRVDWPQMVANLSAIAEGGSIEVGKGSDP